MWENVVGQDIRRSTWNVLVVNLVLLGSLVAIAVETYPYLHSAVAGTFRLETGDLLAQPGRLGAEESHVTIQGAEIQRTPWKNITKTVNKAGQVKSEHVTANYSWLMVGDKILLVRHAPDAWPDTTCSGRLVPLPDDVRRTFMNPLFAQQPAMRGAFLDVMLDQSTGWRWGAYIGLGLGVPVALFSLRNAVRSLRFRFNPYRHPQLKRLAARGDVDEQLAALDRQSENSQWFGSIRLTPDWLVRSSFFGFDLVPLVDLVWGTILITRQYTNSRLTSQTFIVELYDINRRAYRFDVASEEQGTELLRSIVARVPWMLVGGEELQKSWKEDAKQIIQAVEVQRKLFSGWYRPPEGQGPGPST